jgi:hypothetical protein
LNDLTNANDLAGQINNGKSYVTPEMEAQATLPDKIMGGIAGALPVVAGVLGTAALTAAAAPEAGLGLLAGAGAMGLHSALSSSRSDLEQGVDLSTTAEKAAVQGTLGFASGLLPGVGSTVLKSAGIGMASNVPIGIAGDIVDKAILEANGYDKIAEQIHPFDINKIVVSGAVGGIMGAAFKVGERMNMTPEQRRIVDAIEAMPPEERTQANILKLHIMETIGRDLGKIDTTGAMSWVDLEDSMNFDSKNIKAVDVLKAFVTDPTVGLTPDQKALSAAYLRVADAVGLSETTMRMLDSTHERMKLPDGRIALGEYVPGEDQINLNSKYAYTPDQFETILHEIGHGILYGAMHHYDSITRYGMRTLDNLRAEEYGPWSRLNDAGKTMMEHMEKFRQHFDYVSDQTRTQWAKEASQGKVYTPEEAARRSRVEYALSDWHEYATMSMTSLDFQKHLDSLKVNSPHGLDFMPFKISNRFQEFKAAMLSILKGDQIVTKPEMTMLNVAQDHMFRVLNDSYAEMRLRYGPNDANAIMTGPERGRVIDEQNAARALEAKRLMVEGGLWNEFHSISKLLQTAASLKEFTTRMNMRSSAPEWRDYVARNAEHLYNNADQIVNAVGKSQNFDLLEPNVKALLGDPRSPEEFFKAIQEKLPEGEKKITMPQDIDRGGTWLWGPDQLRMIKGPDTLGGQVLSYYLSKAQEYRSLKAQYYAESQAMTKAFRELKRTPRENVMRAVQFWDHGQGNKILLDDPTKPMWPTRDQLIQHGLTAEEATAYEGRAKAMDWLMDSMDQERLHQGMPPIPRKPGYMQHGWDRTFKVLVDAIELDANGKVLRTRTVEVHDFKTQFMANRLVKNLNRGKYDTTANAIQRMVEANSGAARIQFRANIDPLTKSPIRVSGSKLTKSEDFINVLSQNLISYENQAQMGPEVVKALEAISNDNLIGLNKHLMDRTDIRGFLGDMRPLITGEVQHPLSTSKWAGLGFDSTTNKILDLDKNYARTMSEYLGNAAFTREVVRPMLDHAMDTKGLAPLDPFEHTQRWGEMLDNTPQLREYMRDFAHNFTGQSLNYLHFLDREMTYEPNVLLGLSPRLVPQTLTMLRNIFSYAKLRLNPGFYVGNTVQWTYTLGMLEVANAMARNSGRPMKTSLATLGSFVRDMKDPKARVEMLQAVEWARDNHVLESFFEQQLRMNNDPTSHAETVSGWINKATGAGLNPAIEDKSRTWSFQIAFKHFRENGFSVEDSRTAAAQIMRQTNTDYMRESRPLMFQQLGLLGKAMSPFQVYRSAQLGNLYMTAKVLIQSGFKEWKPMVTTMLTFMLMAGVSGVPLAAEWDKLTELWNEHVPEHPLPSLFVMMKKLGAPDWMVWGAISAGSKALPGMDHGINLSGSLGSVDLEQGIPQAMVPFLGGLKETAGLLALAGGNMLGMNRPVNRADVHKAASTITPGFMQPWLQQWLQLDNSRVYPTAQGLTGEYERTDSDIRANIIGNRQSVTEASERKITQWVEVQLKNKEDTVKQYLQTILDHQYGKGIQSNVDDALKYLLSVDGGMMTREQVEEQVVKMAEKELTTPRTRDADLSGMRGAWKQQIRQSLGQ